GQRIDEADAGRDGEDVEMAAAHATPMRAPASRRVRTSARPAGVATWYHSPSWRRPYRRPTSMARRHKGWMEKAPSGAPARRGGGRLGMLAKTRGATTRGRGKARRPS